MIEQLSAAAGQHGDVDSSAPLLPGSLKEPHESWGCSSDRRLLFLDTASDCNLRCTVDKPFSYEAPIKLQCSITSSPSRPDRCMPSWQASCFLYHLSVRHIWCSHFSHSPLQHSPVDLVLFGRNKTADEPVMVFQPPDCISNNWQSLNT